MTTRDTRQQDLYHELVLNKYQVFNSLFMNLPYEQIENIGMLIPILLLDSKRGFEEGKNPSEIVEDFFQRRTIFKTEKERNDFLFRVIQYVERQVVLFDSVEDSAFLELKKYSDHLTLEKVTERAEHEGDTQALKKKLEDFGVRIVFTAHPTQFYPETVQYIIEDLIQASSRNDIQEVSELLKQLGMTSFVNDTKPTPYDEAMSIIYYLRYVYYDAVGTLYGRIQQLVETDNDRLIQLGFWPGGDRDGNPFVTADTTLRVANELRMAILKCYYNHLKAIRRRLTFKNVKPILDQLSDQLYEAMFDHDGQVSYQEILQPLERAREALQEKHGGLFIDQLDSLIQRIKIFKTHFATLDIRQDSSVHVQLIEEIFEKYKLSDQPYQELNDEERIEILLNKKIQVEASDFESPVLQDTITNIKQLKKIQELNGEQGCNRYIISNSEDIFAVLHVIGLFRFCGWRMEDITFDIIPLFETIKGLSGAEETMNKLYNLPAYSQHLKSRNKRQTIMLGFSDGTKDGGYLKANLEIMNTKEVLSKISDKNGIRAIFFDGRGGPPARGGGKTHRFYASHGKNIANNEIQLTIQGQTITSMYGTQDQFMHNCEQLITAGISNDILEDPTTHLSEKQRELLEELGDISFEKYTELKNHPAFVPYLEQMSTLKYYGRANIGSRPAKRGKTKQLTLADLRAISFVGSWSQLKQNVPGYFGIGTAINKLKSQGRIQEVKDLFKSSAFFKALISNSMMSLSKTFFPLTLYMREHDQFGPFWNILHDEFQLSKDMMLEISGYDGLLEEEMMNKLSIQTRENMVLPLLTIQQYALQKIAEGAEPREVYEAMVTRSLYGNINASRNSA